MTRTLHILNRQHEIERLIPRNKLITNTISSISITFSPCDNLYKEYRPSDSRIPWALACLPPRYRDISITESCPLETFDKWDRRNDRHEVTVRSKSCEANGHILVCDRVSVKYGYLPGTPDNWTLRHFLRTEIFEWCKISYNNNKKHYAYTNILI